METYLDKERRDPVLEEKLNVHIGKPYRIQQMHVVQDGILAACSLHVCEQGFVLKTAELTDALVFDVRNPSERLYAANVMVRDRVDRFQRIRDEEGFQRVQQRYKQ